MDNPHAANRPVSDGKVGNSAPVRGSREDWALEKSGIASPDVRATLESTSNLLRQLQIEAEATACLVEIIDRAELRDDGISVTLRIQVHCSRAGVRTSSILNLSRFVPLTMKRRGVETRIIMAAGNGLPRKLDPALLKAAARARRGLKSLPPGGRAR